MAGRVRSEDVALVRERVRVDSIIGEVVTLRPAGAGSLKGLCPFHDERSPSFHVTPPGGCTTASAAARAATSSTSS